MKKGERCSFRVCVRKANRWRGGCVPTDEDVVVQTQMNTQPMGFAHRCTRCANPDDEDADEQEDSFVALDATR